MADLVIPTQSWISIAEADLYFKYRLNSDAWKAAPMPEKEAALVTARRQLLMVSSGLPTDPSADMTAAACEQALFLLQQDGDNDRRAALQAQGVTAAGIVKEQYSGGVGIAIAPMAKQLLISFFTPQTGGVFSADLTRCEES